MRRPSSIKLERSSSQGSDFMGLRFIKIAVVYLLIGASLGLVMGVTQRFTLAPVHAHLLLLGWASLAIAGVVYHLYPMASTTRLARVHFWLHNLGLPVFMVGLGMLLSGAEAAGPIVAASASTVLVGLALFALNVLMNAKAAA
jgi:cbb3-type cytochrome oxidase subunit 1